MASVTLHSFTTSGSQTHDLDDRGPIVSHLLDNPWYGHGDLEQLRSRIDHQDRVLKAILLGCSKKDFRHTVEHFGLRVTN